jgi:hypothetical protein
VHSGRFERRSVVLRDIEVNNEKTNLCDCYNAFCINNLAKIVKAFVNK